MYQNLKLRLEISCVETDSDNEVFYEDFNSGDSAEVLYIAKNTYYCYLSTNILFINQVLMNSYSCLKEVLAVSCSIRRSPAFYLCPL